jgi:lysophospholipase L1-like esterase
MTDWFASTSAPLTELVAPSQSAPPQAGSGALRRAFGIACGLMLAIGATYVVPALGALRPWTPGSGYVPFWNVIGRELLGEGKALAVEAQELRELQQKTELPLAASAPVRERAARPARPMFPAYPPGARVERPETGIEFSEALEAYFTKLTLVDLGIDGAIARTGHWGDSVLGMDGITSGIRRRLQRRFGDAGHGFHLIDRYHPSYQQQGIEFTPGGGWDGCLVIYECRAKQDRRYGYGGYVVSTDPWSVASAVYSTPKKGFGSTVSTFEVWFQRQPRGGKIELGIDRQEKVVIDTRGEVVEDGSRMVYVPPGPHTFTLTVPSGTGAVRAYGVVLENDGPGVVWDGMALIGGSTRGLRTQDDEHVEDQVRRRGLDLIAFQFGGNDLARKYVDLKDSMQPYYDEYGEVVRKFRAGRPEASCLILSVIDHGERKADDRIVTKSFVKTLVQAQREVARQNGCAFFDTFEAMGGEGTAARWYRSNPRMMAPDLGHPTGTGHEVLAGLISHALLYDYDQFRERMAGKPLPLPAEKAPEKPPIDLDALPDVPPAAASAQGAAGDVATRAGSTP